MQEPPQESWMKYAVRVATATATAAIIFTKTLDASKARYEAEMTSDAMKGGARSWGSGRTLQEKRDQGECPDQRTSK